MLGTLYPIEHSRSLSNLYLHNILFIVAVYLPTSKESINIFKAYLGTFDEILCSLEHDGTVMVVGDSNAHIGNLGGPRCLNRINGQGTYLYERLEKYDFVSINSQSFCQGPIATFYAAEYLVATTVGHIFIQQIALSLVLDPIVVEDCSSNLSFHLPISCTVKTDLKMEKRKQDKHTVNWKKLSSSDLQKYGTEVTARLQEISLMYQDIPLKDEIDNMVKDLSEVLHLATEAITRTKKPRPHAKHYWNCNLSAYGRILFSMEIYGWKKGNSETSIIYRSSILKNPSDVFVKHKRKAIYDDEIRTFERLENLHNIDSSLVFHKISRKINPKVCQVLS